MPSSPAGGVITGDYGPSRDPWETHRGRFPRRAAAGGSRGEEGREGHFFVGARCLLRTLSFRRGCSFCAARAGEPVRAPMFSQLSPSERALSSAVGLRAATGAPGGLGRDFCGGTVVPVR